MSNADDRSQNRSAQLSAVKAESRWTRGSLHGPFSTLSCQTKHFPASGSSRVQPSTPHLETSSVVYIQLSFMACEVFCSSSRVILITSRSGAATLIQINDDMGLRKNNLPLLKLFNVQRRKLSWQRQKTDVQTAWLADIRPSEPP